MSECTDYGQWQSCQHDDEPRDQQIDLFGGYWAEVGPDSRQAPDGWSWTILVDSDGDAVADGFAADETSAKAAVMSWADENETLDQAAARRDDEMFGPQDADLIPEWPGGTCPATGRDAVACDTPDHRNCGPARR